MKPDKSQSSLFGVRYWKLSVVLLVGLPVLVLTSLLTVSIFRAFLLSAPEGAMNHLFNDVIVDLVDEDRSVEMVQRLSGALQIQTVNYEPGKLEFAALTSMHKYLEDNFPLVHASSFISREVVSQYSLLYTIEGSVNGTLPYLVSGHIDVVPADPSDWDVPPFSGKVVDSFIYGRGSLDDKARVIGLFEALEFMLEQGYRPKRSFFIAIGHDEETGGDKGAKGIANTLKSRGINELDFILDEGHPLSKGMFPGTEKTVGMIGVTEKGSTTLKLTVLGNPGHSSFPPQETAIGILAAAIAKLEQDPQPSQFGNGPEAQTFADIASHCTFGYRLLYSNLWLFRGLMAKQMSKSPVTNAIVRTTIAITIFNGGIKENVIPPSASALIHLHIHPSQSVAQAVSLVRETIADSRVLMSVRPGKIPREAHPISPSGPRDKQYQVVATSVRQVIDDVVVVPGVVIGNTDSRWYLSFSRNIYRMYPFVLASEDFKRSHGNNERIAVKQYHNVVNFFYRLIKNSDILLDTVSEHSQTIPCKRENCHNPGSR